MRYRFLYGKRTLKTRRPCASRTFRTRYQHTEGSSWIWHILFPQTSAYCGRSISVRLPCRGRAERSHSVCIACLLRTGRTSAYAEKFCACIKFLGVRNELRRTSAYDTVIGTLAQPPPDVLPTCISVWQKLVIRRYTQSSYADMWRPLKICNLHFTCQKKNKNKNNTVSVYPIVSISLAIKFPFYNHPRHHCLHNLSGHVSSVLKIGDYERRSGLHTRIT